MIVRKLLCVTLGSPPPDAAELLSLSRSWELHYAADLKAAHRMLHDWPLQVGLLLLHQIDADTYGEIDGFLKTHWDMQWVGVFPADSVRSPACRELILGHLFDFHTWPIDEDRLNHALGHAFGYADLYASAAHVERSENMGFVGRSVPINKLRQQILKVANTNAPVLIWGESGSGKELAAHAIHENSARGTGPFIAVN